MRKVESIECVRLNRDNARQNLGFSSRPFVLCGLPVKRPARGSLLHERRNGKFILQVTGHPSYGLPWAGSACTHLSRNPGDPPKDAAGHLRQRGRNVEHLRHAAGWFAVPATCSIFSTHLRRDDFLRDGCAERMRDRCTSCPVQLHDGGSIWYSRDGYQKFFPGDCQNMIVLSDEFYHEIQNRPIPADLEAAKALRRRRQRSISTCGFLIDASPRKEKSGCRCTGNSGS